MVEKASQNSRKSFLSLVNTTDRLGTGLYLKTLLGKNVIDSAAVRLGKVEDFVIDETQWKANQLVIKLESTVAEELDMKKMLRATKIHVPISIISAVGDVVTLLYKKGELKEVIQDRV